MMMNISTNLLLTSIGLLSGPIIAFLYCFLVYIVYAVTGECTWTEKTKLYSLTTRFTFLITSIAICVIIFKLELKSLFQYFIII